MEPAGAPLASAGVIGGIPGGIGTGSGGGVGSGHGAGGIGPGMYKLGDAGNVKGIYGVVRDSTGAAIANAHITATSESGAAHSTYSDSNGNFRLEIQPGTYSVQAQMTGFQSAVENVQYSGGSRYLSYNLKVGSATETVEVVSWAESTVPG